MARNRQCCQRPEQWERLTLPVEIGQRAVAAVTQRHKMLSRDFGLGIERLAADHARCASGHARLIMNVLLRRYSES